MFLLVNFCELSVVVLSIQILEVNSSLYDLFPRVQLLFANSQVIFNDVVSKFKDSLPGFNLSYFKRVKGVASNIDEIATCLYKNVKSVISNSNDFIAHFKTNNYLWNWTTGFPAKPCARFNATAFKFQIKHELFGQHLVEWCISKLLKNHFEKHKLQKPLIMSFHGQTGCGKTFVSKLIVDSIFKEGFNSKFVHVYHGSLDFPHEKNKEKYQERLRQDMLVSSRICDRSVFIFDEMDKMVPGVIDALIPYISFYENNTMNSMKNIFLFLSNAGDKKIEQIMYDAWFKGISREDMTLKNFSSFLKASAYDEPGGLQHSEIVDKNFIDVFVPFLPLEKKHVEQCIVKELKLNKKSFSKDIVEKIAFQFEYYPPEFNLFSVCGCKKVAFKVDLYSDAY